MNPRTVAVVVAAAALVLMPIVGTEFFVNFVLTRTLIIGLAASSIVFLASYAGMVSLAQYLLVGVASFTIGNCVAESGKGLKMGLDPWLAVVIALAIAPVAVAAEEEKREPSRTVDRPPIDLDRHDGPVLAPVQAVEEDDFAQLLEADKMRERAADHAGADQRNLLARHN